MILDWDGVPDFERRVYDEARRIPPGRTATYGQIAAALGEPGAARAVGRALSPSFEAFWLERTTAPELNVFVLTRSRGILFLITWRNRWLSRLTHAAPWELPAMAAPLWNAILLPLPAFPPRSAVPSDQPAFLAG